MDQITSSQTERDLNNVIDNFGDIGRNDDKLLRDAKIVIFMMDTTHAKSTEAEICQISAWCNSNTFNVYILPKEEILTTFLNGIRINNERKMFHNGIEVNAISPEQGLQKFLDFLGDSTDRTGKVLLAANGYSPLLNLIIRIFKQYDLFETFETLVLGFIDTINVFKSTSKNKGEKNDNFALEKLASKYLGPNAIPEGQLHAKVNVDLLVQLIKNERIGCTDEIMKQHVKKLRVLTGDLGPLKVLSKTMQDRIKDAGITVTLLQDVYKANGTDGVANMLGEKVNGKVRVTKDKKVIQKIINAITLPSDEEGAAGNASVN